MEQIRVRLLQRISEAAQRGKDHGLEENVFLNKRVSEAEQNPALLQDQGHPGGVDW